MLSLHGAGTLNHRKMKKILHLLLILYLLPLAGQAGNLVSFKKVSKVTSGKRYLIVYRNDYSTYVAKAILEIKPAPLGTFRIDNDNSEYISGDIIKVDAETYAFTFTAYGSGFVIKSSNNMYLGQPISGTDIVSKNSFSADDVWSIEPNAEDGTFSIGIKNTANASRYLKSDGEYFRCYSAKTKYKFFPSLYEEISSSEPRTLTDDMSATNDFSAAEGLDVTVHRPLVGSSWNAICLPFDMNDSQLKSTFGEGVKVATLTAAEDGNASFSTLPTPQIEAGKPYLLFNPGGALSEFTVNDVTINSNTTTEPTVGNDFSFVGTLDKSDIAAGDYFFSTKKANTIVKQGANGSIKAFRAYLKANSNEARLSSFVVDHQTTSIANITIVAAHDEKVYNLNGQEVDRFHKGIEIRNGKKYINK